MKGLSLSSYNKFWFLFYYSKGLIVNIIFILNIQYFIIKFLNLPSIYNKKLIFLNYYIFISIISIFLKIKVKNKKILKIIKYKFKIIVWNIFCSSRNYLKLICKTY